MKRKILRQFRLHELSAVDHPAQQGAKAVLMKRHDQESPVQKIESFADFKSACDRLIEKSSDGKTSRTEMLSRIARSHPELMKHRYATEPIVDDVQKAHAASVAQRQHLDDLVTTTAAANKCDRQTALRMVRQSHPELFAYGEF